MFTKDKVISAATKITTSKSWPSTVTAATQVRGSLSGVGSNLSVSNYTNNQYFYYMTGLLPANPDFADTTSLALFYRDIYLHDNIGGSCVDIQSTFPFSDWELRGLNSPELKVFNDALERLNLRELLPQISIAYLTDGFYAGSMVFDPKAKNFQAIMTHDALQCAITPSAFNNLDPAIRVSTSGYTMQLLEGATDYDKLYVENLPENFVNLLRQGSFILDPVSTLFVARKTLTDRAYMSYLHRILPMYLIEKTMYRGTLIEANRRQRAMTHIQAGDDVWTPTSEELNVIVQQFQLAENDPIGGWISTRNAVQVQDLRPGGDFWKWTDMGDTLVNYKLRALGISEAFLSGDSSYAACLVGSTLIQLTDGTTKTIQELAPVSNPTVGEWYNLELSVPNRVSDCAKVRAWAFNGVKETFTITTEDNYSITATANHPFWVMNEVTGECSWKRLDELQEGDLVAVE